MNKPGVCLSIIVKNEEKVIERMLETVYPILDHYIVVDTGSTDKTKEIVTEFFKNKGIPGKVVDHKWVNFETARNFALQQSKESGMSHSFWIDADEQLIIAPDFQQELLKKALSNAGSATIEVKYGNTTYTRNQFWNNSEEFYWYGPVHEVLMCDKPALKPIFVKGLHTLVLPDGNSWTSMSQQEKYERDAKLLEEYVANDPKKDARWVFYLAQSYRDAVATPNLLKSIEWYTKRRDMDSGYREERYFSQLMVATLKARVNEHIQKGIAPKELKFFPSIEILDDYLHAGDFDDLRAEHFIPIIKHYQTMKRWQSAYVLSEFAFRKFHKNSPYPKRGLFIDAETYSWKIADCHTISAWYAGKRDESKKAMQQCMNAVNKGLVVNPNDVNRLKANLEFYKKK